MNHPIAWFEIPAVDLQRARRFYETIFAIEMRPLDAGQLQMALFPTRGALCQLASHYKPSADQGPLLYFSAEPDLAGVLGKVGAAGGRILVAKRQISPEYGYMALLVDTEGNRIALHSTK